MEKFQGLGMKDTTSLQSLLNERDRRNSDEDGSEELKMDRQDDSLLKRHSYTLIFSFTLVVLNVIFCISYLSWVESRYSRLCPLSHCEHTYNATSNCLSIMSLILQ